MLATQILKHVDSDQPIRLLIAECERPLTIMSALYLAHKFGIADMIDISPLFETSYGLEHGEKIIDQLLRSLSLSTMSAAAAGWPFKPGFPMPAGLSGRWPPIWRLRGCS